MTALTCSHKKIIERTSVTNAKSFSNISYVLSLCCILSPSGFCTSQLAWNLKLFISKRVLWQAARPPNGDFCHVSGQGCHRWLRLQARQSPWLEGPDWKPTPEWTRSISASLWDQWCKNLVSPDSLHCSPSEIPESGHGPEEGGGPPSIRQLLLQPSGSLK